MGPSYNVSFRLARIFFRATNDTVLFRFLKMPERYLVNWKGFFLRRQMLPYSMVSWKCPDGTSSFGKNCLRQRMLPRCMVSYRCPNGTSSFGKDLGQQMLPHCMVSERCSNGTSSFGKDFLKAANVTALYSI